MLLNLEEIILYQLVYSYRINISHLRDRTFCQVTWQSLVPLAKDIWSIAWDIPILYKYSWWIPIFLLNWVQRLAFRNWSSQTLNRRHVSSLWCRTKTSSPPWFAMYRLDSNRTWSIPAKLSNSRASVAFGMIGNPSAPFLEAFGTDSGLTREKKPSA